MNMSCFITHSAVIISTKLVASSCVHGDKMKKWIIEPLLIFDRPTSNLKSEKSSFYHFFCSFIRTSILKLKFSAGISWVCERSRLNNTLIFALAWERLLKWSIEKIPIGGIRIKLSSVLIQKYWNVFKPFLCKRYTHADSLCLSSVSMILEIELPHLNGECVKKRLDFFLPFAPLSFCLLHISTKQI